MEFVVFPKIPRWKGDGIVITEKIDGTNGQVVIPEDNGPILVGSRSCYITPDRDNFGFARFVMDNEELFRKLGPGRHFGEWWGRGIQRGYGLNYRVFSLFNVLRHDNVSETVGSELIRTVPILYSGEMSSSVITTELKYLRINGSIAAPGYDRPEGVIIYHRSSRHLYKYTLDGDKK